MRRFIALIKAPHIAFLALVIPFGLLFILLIPALQGWDEVSHFQRSYQISEGNFSAHKVAEHDWGDQLPVNVSQMTDAFLTDLINSKEGSRDGQVHTRAYITYLKVNQPSDNTADRGFVNTAVYHPVAYAAPAVGVAIAKLIDLPIISYIYMARFFAFMLFVAIMFYAIRRMPVGKWVLVVVGLLPTTLTVAASSSPDALIIALASLLVAIYIDYLIKPRRISKKDIAIIATSVIVLPLSKSGYILFSGLFFFWPVKIFGTLKRHLAANALLVFSVVSIALAWTLSVDKIANDMHYVQRPGINVDPVAQQEFILNNPIDYSIILGNQLFTANNNAHYIQLVSQLTWKGVSIPSAVSMFCYLVLATSLILTHREFYSLKKPRVISKIGRYGPLLPLIGMVILINTILYLAFTPVANHRIDGVQGRYFIALIPLLIPMMLNSKKYPLFSEKGAVRLPRFLFIACASILVITLIAVIAKNWIPDWIPNFI